MLPTCRSQGWSRQRSRASGWCSAAFCKQQRAAGLGWKGARKPVCRKKARSLEPVTAALRLGRFVSRVLQRRSQQGLPSQAPVSLSTDRAACSTCLSPCTALTAPEAWQLLCLAAREAQPLPTGRRRRRRCCYGTAAIRRWLPLPGMRFHPDLELAFVAARNAALTRR